VITTLGAGVPAAAGRSQAPRSRRRSALERHDVSAGVGGDGRFRRHPACRSRRGSRLDARIPSAPPIASSRARARECHSRPLIPPRKTAAAACASVSPGMNAGGCEVWARASNHVVHSIHASRCARCTRGARCSSSRSSATARQKRSGPRRHAMERGVVLRSRGHGPATTFAASNCAGSATGEFDDGLCDH